MPVLLIMDQCRHDRIRVAPPGSVKFRLLLALGFLAASLAGCMSPEQASDWRWRQHNPDYRPPLPPTESLQ